jgi:hypothetical protein
MNGMHRALMLAAIAAFFCFCGAPAKAQIPGGGCATATTSILGCVKPDGTTITISSGVISAVGGFPPSGCSASNGVIINNATPCSANFTSDGSGNTLTAGTFTFGAGPAIISSPTAAGFQFGAANVNGAPVAQTLSFQGALAGSATNTASANETIIGSLGTGTGTNGDIIFQTGVKTTTGTAQATPTTAMTIKGETGQIVAASTIAIPAGSASTASIQIAGTAGTGIFGAAGGVFFTVGGTSIANAQAGAFVISAAALNMVSTASLIFNSDTFFTRGGAAATLKLGANADAASPVAQTLGVQNVVTGTSNTGGANFTFNGSKSTGTGVGGKITFQTTVTGTTGSTVNSNFPMLTLNPGSATTSTVQFGDGTNITTYDSCTALTTGATGVVACTASAIRFKDLGVPHPLNLAGLDDLRTEVPWSYRKDAGFGLDPSRIHVGLFADEVAAMDARCGVWRHGDLEPSDYEDRCVIAYLVASQQEMRREIQVLRERNP